MLIAKVNILAFVEGKRVGFMPGDEVSGLHEHDVRELLAADAIEDVAKTRRQAKDDAAAEEAARREFEEARQRALAAQASLQTGTAEEAGQTGTSEEAGQAGGDKPAAARARKK